MITRKILLALAAVAGLAVALAASSSPAASNCGGLYQPYCPAPSGTTTQTPPPAPPPPSTAPAPTLESDGTPAVTGTLTGGTTTVELPNSSNPDGGTDFAINLAGSGTLVIKTATQTFTVTVAPDGTTTIAPPTGPPIVLKGDAGRVGRIGIAVAPNGTITFSLTDPGEKTVQIGSATTTVPGQTSITHGASGTTYVLLGSGKCGAVLDPAVSENFQTGPDVQCVVDSPSTASTSRSVRAASDASENDRFSLGNKADRVSAGLGDDIVSAGGGNDVVYGDRSLAGLAHHGLRAVGVAAAARLGGNDVLNGDAGNDIIYGDGGNDRITGGSGNDVVYGNEGRDTVSGGSGNDVVHVRGGSTDTVTCGPGRDVVIAGPTDKVARDCEDVRRPRPHHHR